MLGWFAIVPWNAVHAQETEGAREDLGGPGAGAAKDVIAAVVTIETGDSHFGGQGGTGFFAEYHGRYFVVTNMHVFFEAARAEALACWEYGPQLTHGRRDSRFRRSATDLNQWLRHASRQPFPVIRDVEGKVVEPLNLFASQGRDLLLIEVEKPTHHLQFSSQTSNYREGDELQVAGNPGARHVIHSQSAVLKAIGPERIEIQSSGKIVPGHSGSPVFDRQTLEVIGVITFLQHELRFKEYREFFDYFSGHFVGMFRWEVETRYFATRMDNLNDLEQLHWDEICHDAALLLAVESRNRNLATIASAIGTGRDHRTMALQPDFNNRLSLFWTAFVRDLRNSNTMEDALLNVNRQLRFLENAGREDLGEIDLRSGYARRVLNNEIRPLRDQFTQGIRLIMQDTEGMQRWIGGL